MMRKEKIQLPWRTYLGIMKMLLTFRAFFISNVSKTKRFTSFPSYASPVSTITNVNVEFLKMEWSPEIR
jgi:hypothetical protein